MLGTGIRNGVKKWSWTSYLKEKVGQAKKCASCVSCVTENGSAFISAALLLEGEKPIRQIDNGSRSGVSLGLLCSLVAEKTLRHDFAINGAR